MKLYMGSVYDKAVGAFMPPFFCRSRGEAMRSFIDACRPDAPSGFARHPEDFVLMLVGEFDDAEGSVTSGSVGGETLMTGLAAVASLSNG